MAVTVKKDKKGPCFFLSHKRVSFTEGIWLTLDELKELKKLIEEIV